MAEILDILSALESGNDTAGTGQEKLAGFMERAKAQRAKMVRNLSQADDFIARMGTST